MGKKVVNVLGASLVGVWLLIYGLMCYSQKTFLWLPGILVILGTLLNWYLWYRVVSEKKE